MIVVRSHGGLGNQLFQVAQALLWQRRDGGQVARLHDTRYKVVFPASPVFVDLDAPVPLLPRAASWLRLPKLLTRAGVATNTWRLASTSLLAGYFQAADDWRRFPAADTAAVLADLRRRLGIVPAGGTGLLVHLRLGDFFADEAAERAHLDTRLTGLPEGATLISNRDPLLTGHAKLLATRGLVHQPTATLSPEAVIALMAGFGRIDSNDSTLAFWAALLGGADLRFRSPILAATFAVLRAAEG